MFVAFDTVSGRRLTTISLEWISRPADLRTWARSRRLLCPGCRQPLWFRVGQTRRPHFAHRQSASCPLAHDSPEVREATAQLYEWLESKYPGQVELDFDFGLPNNKYPSSLFLEVDETHRFAYWIFDRAKRNRERLFQTGSMSGVRHHVVHTQAALSVTDDLIHLTASQREFASISSYDAYHWAGLGHLHFLDPATSELHIYRGLREIHAPAGHTWSDLRSGPLTTALISPATGELVFPEDVEARRRYREEVQNQGGGHGRQILHSREEEDHDGDAEEERDEAEADQLHQSRDSQPSRPRSRPDRTRVLNAHPPPLKYRPLPRRPSHPPPSPPEPPPNPLSAPLRCEDCGQVTTEWSQATPGEGTCVCRACSAKRYRDFSSGDT